MSDLHPCNHWLETARQPQHPLQMRLRLAAMAAHMRVDETAARRAALIDLLADGRPHEREAIWQAIAAQLGPDCWGKRPREALARDLHVLRQGGLRIAYSRRPGAAGYYLQYPPIEPAQRPTFGEVNQMLVERIRELPVPEKNARAFAAAEFALRQKQLILAEENPTWSTQQVEQTARRLVYGDI